jgi:uncharacterized alpha-E superfamily protein
MLSRVAESIYWMSRYLERAENLARIIDVHANISLDLPGGDQNNWSALIETTGDYDRFAEVYPSQERHHVIQFLAFDDQNPNSIRSCIASARENARSIREIIPPEFWEQINHLYHSLQATPPSTTHNPQQLYAFFREIILEGLSFGGIASDTMDHSEGWQWFCVGRLLERADKTSRILDVKYYALLPDSKNIGTPLDQVQWTGLLKSTSALEVYRAKHGQLNSRDIIAFMVLDRTFPRAIMHCLKHSDNCLRAVLGTNPNYYQNRAEQLLGQLCSEVSYSSIDSIIGYGLHQYIDMLQMKLNEIGDAIHECYFAV